LHAIAPERSDELVREIFKGEKWHLRAVSGAPVAGVQPFEAVPEDRVIKVSSSGLAMLWCISAYAALTLDTVNSAGDQHGGETDVGNLFSRLKGYLDYAEYLGTHYKEWPQGLYQPNPDAKGEPFETIDRILLGAGSWILLHEIAYVYFQHKKNVLPRERIKQEDAADEFAASWVFEKVGSYREREFRILAVGVAVAWLLLFEPIGGDPNHPPAVNRMMHISSYFAVETDSVALEIVAHLVKILFFPAEPIPEFDSAQALFDWTVELFREPSALVERVQQRPFDVCWLL
jgi:hypothetical protein